MRVVLPVTKAVNRSLCQGVCRSCVRCIHCEVQHSECTETMHCSIATHTPVCRYDMYVGMYVIMYVRVCKYI